MRQVQRRRCRCARRSGLAGATRWTRTLRGLEDRARAQPGRRLRRTSAAPGSSDRCPRSRSPGRRTTSTANQARSMTISARATREADDEADGCQRQEQAQLLPGLVRDQAQRVDRSTGRSWNVPVNCSPKTTYLKFVPASAGWRSPSAGSWPSGWAGTRTARPWSARAHRRTLRSAASAAQDPRIDEQHVQADARREEQRQRVVGERHAEQRGCTR